LATEEKTPTATGAVEGETASAEDISGALGFEIGDSPFSLELSQDQLDIQEWAHGFAENTVRPAAEEWDEREEFPWPIVQEAAKIGLYGFEAIAQFWADPSGLTMPIVNEELFWGDAGIGKTVVSSGMIDRVAARQARRLFEVPVGFKWFVQGLSDGTLGFGGEESAGASFLREDGTAWSTDKDGLLLGLLAAEMMATTGRDPGEHYADLTREFGAPAYERIDAPATKEQKAALSALSPSQVTADTLAGERIEAMLTTAPGNGAAIGGLKVATANGWFAARPSGTEDVYKLYAESFLGADHLRKIQEEAKALIARVLSSPEQG